ncbi:unnamed protein product [Brassica rapa subsp. narinosa]
MLPPPTDPSSSRARRGPYRHRRRNATDLSRLVMNITFALSVLGFLIMHIMLVIRNTTTIEAYEKHTAPNSLNNLGRKQNFEKVFGKDKLYWFVPLYTQDDMKRMPALRGLDFTSRSEESEPLQSL